MVSQSFSDEEEDLATLFDFDFRTKSDSELLLSDPILEWLAEPNPNNNPDPMSDNLFDHQKESILMDKKMEKVSLLDSNPSTDKEEKHQHLQEEINTAAPGNGGESKETDMVGNDVAIEGNTTTNNQSTENEESEDSSSAEDDDSSSSSSDSDSSSSSGDEDEDESSSSSSDKELDEEVEEGEIRGGGDDEFIFGSDGEEVVVPKGPIKSKHEIEDYPPVPPITVSLEPHHQTLPVGVVSSIMGSKVIVEGSENHNPLNEGSILWITETRLPLGIVDEIFGPVKNPYYIVRYNSESEVPEGVKSGIPVSFVADFADHIINYKSLYQKGYDASGADDEEVDLELEFSDDEKEAEYRRSLRQSKRDKNHKEGSNSSGSNKKKYVSKGDGRFSKFNAPQPSFNSTRDGVKGTSSSSFPPQHSIGTPNLGISPQQFTNGPPPGLPPRPHNMYPTMPNWIPNQQQNQNFGMMQQQQQQQHQILTNALLGLIGQASLGAMPFGSGPLNPGFNQSGFGQVPFGPMNPNPSGQVPFANPSGQVPFLNPGSQVPFGPMNPNPSGQVPFANPSGQVPFLNPGSQVPFGPMNPNPSGQVPFGPMNPNPSGQVPFGPTNPNANGQVPFRPMSPNGQVVNQNGFGQVPLGSMPNQGEMGGTGSMQFNSERSFSSSGSINNSNNNRGRGRSFGRGRGRNAFGSRGGSKHSG